MKHARSFRQLVLTQFLTVFNDNLFKQTVLLLAIALQGEGGHGQSMAQVLFSLPFIAFAVVAGDCADRFPKRDVILWCKWMEVVVMLLAAVAFVSGNFGVVLGVVFLMGTQSAFLGPAKYGSLPELTDVGELPRANGLFQATVLLGILLGTGAAGHLGKESLWQLGVFMASLALIGSFVAKRMKRIPAASPQKKIHFDPFKRLVTGLTDARAYPGLLPALLGHAVFWFCGSLMLLAWNEFLAVQADGTSTIATSAGTWSLGLACLSLFMAAGAVVAGLGLRGAIPRWMPVLGALGMGSGFLAAGLVNPDPWTIFLCIGGASFFSGFYLIPLRSLMQTLPPHASIGAVLGTGQMLDFLLIFLGALGRPSLQSLGVGPQELLILLAIVLGIAGIMLHRSLPQIIDLSAAKNAN
ncbi:MAG: MFS transporter [Planctomycetota bacterium]|nr:MFS transporter [Planctomycetota bacterium]